MGDSWTGASSNITELYVMRTDQEGGKAESGRCGEAGGYGDGGYLKRRVLQDSEDQ